MEDGFQNFSFNEPFRTGARGVSQGGFSFSGEDDGVQDGFNPDEMTYEVGNLFESAFKLAVGVFGGRLKALRKLNF
ncbi:hypothetical protein CRYUN_Cryun07bG0097800 [Craigia yunnanensis]